MINPARPGEGVDPASPSQAVVLAGDARRRVFVIYLDIEQVTVAGSANIKEPLIDFINRAMSDDDHREQDRCAADRSHDRCRPHWS